MVSYFMAAESRPVDYLHHRQDPSHQQEGQYALYSIYRRVPFSRATNFANGAKKGVCGNYFHETTLVAPFTIHKLTHNGFSVNFGDTNFVKVQKIHEIHKIYGPRKKCFMVYSQIQYHGFYNIWKLPN